MKSKLTLILSLALIINAPSAFGQTDPRQANTEPQQTEESPDLRTSSESSVSESGNNAVGNLTPKQLEQLLAEIGVLKKSDDTLGTFRLIPSGSEKFNRSDLTQLEVGISDGFINKARLSLKNGTIYETGKYSGFHLSRFRKRQDDVVLSNGKDVTDVIMLGDILDYYPAFTNKNFMPNNEIVKLTVNDSLGYLTTNSDLNSYVDLKVFSDIFGLMGKQSNGLVQTELSSDIYFNWPMGWSKVKFLHYVRPHFHWSKFSDDFASHAVTDTTEVFAVDMLKLNQQTDIDLGITLNLIRFDFNSMYFELNSGTEYKFSDVRQPNKTDNETLSLVSYFAQAYGQLLKYNNFGLEVGTKWYLQKIENRSVTDNGKYQKFYNFEFQMFYNPPRDPDARIFARTQAVNAINPGQSDPFYTLLQFGYKKKFEF